MKVKRIIYILILISIMFTNFAFSTEQSTLEDMEKNKILVTDYGAKGDGITDDTVAIKNALAAIQEGQTLYFPKGEYIISSVLSIKSSNITIQGENGTIIRYPDGSDKSGGVFMIHTANIKNSIENVTFDNIAIDGNKDNRTGTGTGYGIGIIRYTKDYEVKNISIINCKIYDMPGRAISISGCKENKEGDEEDPLYKLGTTTYTQRSTIYDDLIANNTLNGYENINERDYKVRYPVVNTLIQNCYIDNTACGINQNTTDGTRIINNTISNSTKVENITVDYSDNCEVIGNTLLAYNGGCGNIGTDESNNCIIKDNFIDNTNAEVGDLYNVGICHNSAAGSSDNYIIENNTIIGANYGIWLKDHRKYITENNVTYINGGSRAGQNFYLINNTIKDCKTYGIRVDEMTGPTYLINNDISNAQEDASYEDIFINEYNYMERFNETNSINNVWKINTLWTKEEKETTITIQSDRILKELEHWTLSDDGYSLTTTYTSNDTAYKTTDVEEMIEIKDENDNTYEVELSTSTYLGNIDNEYLPIIGSSSSGVSMRGGYSDYDINQTGKYEQKDTSLYYLTDESKEECDGDNLYFVFENIKPTDEVEFYINDSYLNESSDSKDGKGYYGLSLKYSEGSDEFVLSLIHHPTRSATIKQFLAVTEKTKDTYKVTIRFNRYLVHRSANELKICVSIKDEKKQETELMFENTAIDNIETWKNIKLTPDNIVTYESDIIQNLIENKEKIEAQGVKKSGEEENVIDLMIFMGQSNMVGVGGINLPTEEKIEPIKDEDGNTINKEFKLYADTDQKEENPRITDISEPFGLYQNRKADGTLSQSSGSMVTALTNAYYKETGVPVVAISSSVGGMSVYSWWNKDTGEDTGLQDAITKYTAAVEYLTEKGYVIRNKYMVWCQGENDSGTQAIIPVVTSSYYEKYLQEGTSYADKLETIINTMSNISNGNNETIGIDKAFLVRIGHKSGSYAIYDDIMEIQTKLCQENSNVVLASTAFTPLSLCKTTIWNGTGYEYQYMMRNDLLHYHQQAYNLVGYDAGKNIAYYANTGLEPILVDYSVNTEKNTLEDTTYIGYRKVTVNAIPLRKKVAVNVSGNDVDSDIIGYKYSIDGINYTEMIRKQDEYLFEDLSPNTEYTIYAKPVCKDGAILEVVSTKTKTQEENDKIGKIVNVTEYGAIPNDEEPDDAAIRKALDQCEEKDTLYFPEGTYLVESTITISKDNLTILGENLTNEDGNIKDKTIFKYIGSGTSKSVFNVSSTTKSIEGVTFKNISIDGNKDKRAGTENKYEALKEVWGEGYGEGRGIRIYRVSAEYVISDIQVVNCHIYDTPSRAVTILGQAKEIENYDSGYTGDKKYEDTDKRESNIMYPVYATVIKNCNIERCGGGVNQKYANGTQIINNTIYNTIAENITMDYTDNGITIGNNIGTIHGGCGNIGTDATNNCIIMGNYIDGTGNSFEIKGKLTANSIFNVGICHNSYAGKSNNYTIANNTIVNTYYGIWLKDHREYVFGNYGSRAGSNFVLLNNTISDSINREKVDYLNITYSPCNLRIDEMLGATYVSNNKYETSQIIDKSDNIIFSGNNSNENKSIKNISIKTPIKDIYVQNTESLDVTGGVLLVNYTDGTSQEVNITKDMISGFDNTLVGTNTLTLTYKGNQEYTFDIDGSQKSIYEEMKVSFNVYIIQINTYIFNNNHITGILPNTKFSEFIKNIDTNMEVKIVDRDANTINDENALISTGMNVVLQGKSLYRTVVEGDVNSDGIIDISDLGVLAAHIVKSNSLENEYLLAGDLNNDGIVDISDLSIVSRAITQ